MTIDKKGLSADHTISVLFLAVQLSFYSEKLFMIARIRMMMK